MIRIKPLADRAFQSHRVELDGSTYQLDLAWNGRAECWCLSLALEDGTPLVSGLALVSNAPILNRFKFREGMPAGELIAADLTGKISCANYTQLGSEVELIYYEALLGEW